MQHLPNSLETERLLIQRLKYEDAEEIFYAYASKLEATQFVSWPVHQSVADTNRYLRQAVPAWKAGSAYHYSIRTKAENRLIGSVGVVNDKGNIQLGYVMSPTVWNKGYATEAVKALIKQLIVLNGVYRIWTFVDVDNGASQKVLQKAGMIEEARLTKWFRFVNQNNQPRDCVLYRWPN
ncbi:MAG: GNAT family N-acetyltransferase [Cyclobacteriaceae bacterium]|jgi:RimJ/RimL family protein N-acetyltransferase|nr:GNAT family N-acetyltransferase [Cyclobacteriaceae bacterium]